MFLLRRYSASCQRFIRLLPCEPSHGSLQRHLASSKMSETKEDLSLDIPKKSRLINLASRVSMGSNNSQSVFHGKLTRVTPLSTKQRLKRKQQRGKSRDKDYFTMAAYGMAEEFELSSLRKDIENHGVYRIISLPRDFRDVIVASARYTFSNEPREMFIFRNGVVVFWNMPDEERKLSLKFLHPYRVQPYDYSNVLMESEELFYCFGSEATHLVQEDIHLQAVNEPRDEERLRLEKFALSDAMALSVKLGLLESDFNKISADMQPWIEKMKSGGISVSQSAVLKKTGELFMLRHFINVSTDMVETPDLYWDRPELEGLFNGMKSVLSLRSRTNIMNLKLNLCCELTELLSSQLHARHSSRLEWMIIVLILIEVVFETVHYIERMKEKREMEEMENQMNEHSRT